MLRQNSSNSGRFPFKRKISFSSEFKPEQFKKLLVESRVNSVKFISGQNDIIHFKYNRPIDWMGIDTFNPNKPAYTNVANITFGHIEKVSSTECMVRLRFRKWVYFVLLFPLLIPLILLIAYQDIVAFFYYIPLLLGLGIPSLIFYVRTKRYFNLFCKALEQ